MRITGFSSNLLPVPHATGLQRHAIKQGATVAFGEKDFQLPPSLLYNRKVLMPHIQKRGSKEAQALESTLRRLESFLMEAPVNLKFQKLPNNGYFSAFLYTPESHNLQDFKSLTLSQRNYKYFPFTLLNPSLKNFLEKCLTTTRERLIQYQTKHPDVFVKRFTINGEYELVPLADIDLSDATPFKGLFTKEFPYGEIGFLVGNEGEPPPLPEED